MSLNDTSKIFTNVLLPFTGSPRAIDKYVALQVFQEKMAIRRKITSCRRLNVCISWGGDGNVLRLSKGRKSFSTTQNFKKSLEKKIMITRV